MSIRVVDPATTWLLSKDEAKLQLAVDFADDDDLILAGIKGAQGYIEGETQRRYCPQILEWVVDSLCSPMILPVAPGGDCSKIEVVSVTYADINGVAQVLDPALYWVRPAGATVAIVRRRFAVWPWVGDAAELVVIRFAITSEPADASPEVLTAIRLLVAHLYKHREAVVGVDNRDSSTPLPLGVEACLTGERWEAPPCV